MEVGRINKLGFVLFFCLGAWLYYLNFKPLYMGKVFYMVCVLFRKVLQSILIINLVPKNLNAKSKIWHA